MVSWLLLFVRAHSTIADVTEIRNEGTRNNLPTHFDGTTEILSISQIWSTYGEQKASGTLAANFLDAKNNFLDAKNNFWLSSF